MRDHHEVETTSHGHEGEQILNCAKSFAVGSVERPEYFGEVVQKAIQVRNGDEKERIFQERRIEKELFDLTV